MTSDYFDFDEDIILPKSPLSEYLHNFKEFEDQKEEYSTSNCVSLQKTSCSNNKPPIWFFLAILDFIKHTWIKLFNLFIPSLKPFQYLTLKNLLNSYEFHNVLLTENLSFLLNFESEDKMKQDTSVSYSSICLKFCNVFILVLLCIFTHPPFVYLGCSDSLMFHIQYLTSTTFFFLILYVITLFIVIFSFKDLLELLACKLICGSIKTKSIHTEKTTIILQKSLRLVQEAELIARGFTSASVLNVVERLELSQTLPILSPERQYPELRKNIYLWSRERFMLYRNATLQLISAGIINSDFDIASESFAALDLKEFGNLLNFDINSESSWQEFLEITDGLSVSCLKTMKHLNELQVSEFYKFLYLITSLIISSTSFNFKRRIENFLYLDTCIRKLETEETLLKEKAHKVYQYYNSFETQSLKTDCRKLKLNDDRFGLQNYIHNMNLHLKAALKRIIDIEEMLESEEKDNVKKADVLKMIENIMNEASSEINIYQEYYQKCNSKLQSTLYSEAEADEPLSFEKSVELQESQEHPVIVKCDEDLPIEDEIFEAIVTTSLETDDKYDSHDVEGKRQSSDVTDKLMHELKSVLSFKADEHRIREEKALAKKVQKEGTSLANSESEKNTIVSETKAFSEKSDTLSNNKENETNFEYNEIKEDVSSSFNSGKIQIPLSGETPTFAASIAALALQRQKRLGIASEVCFSDGEDSENEITN